MRAAIVVFALTACGGSSSSPPAAAAPPDARVPVIPIGREVESSPARVDLPPAPSFAPHAEPGFRSIAELNLAGKALFGTKVKVRGHVTLVYDCVDDVAQPGEDRAATQRRIDADLALCERRWVRLGPTRQPSPRVDLEVAEVPREPFPIEQKLMSKDELAKWPAVPVFALGDEVIVTGTWTDRSPHGAVAPHGMILYASIEKVAP
jgi:hypothetical protein